MTPDVIVALGSVDDVVATRLAPFGRLVHASDASLRSLLPHAVAVVARGASVVDAGLIDAAPHLRVIGRSGVGVELVDVDAATRRKIPVVVTPGTGSQAVAEGTFALILALVKRLARFTAMVRGGSWADRETLPVRDLEGACLGVVGYGRIGRRVARIGACFGMRVLTFDPYVDPSAPTGDGVQPTGIDELVQTADVVSLHAPLTAENHGLVGAELLSRFRDGAVLVNCGRGGLLDLDAVYDALGAGRLSGVGLDVYETEPPADHPLFHHPDVVLTPHVQGLSERARRLTFEAMADGMAEVLAGRQAPHVANPDVYGSDR